jgi:hypothetical protein
MKTELTPEQKERKRIYQIEYRKKNKDKLLLYRENQKEYVINYRKENYSKNAEKNKEKSRKYYWDNRDKRLIKQKEYKKKNRPKLREYQNDYFNNRVKNDHLFRLKNNIRGLIYQSLKNKGIKKNSKTEQILGCTFQQFKEHLENQFEPWMNWDNYGLYNGELNYGWDIDHVIPVSSGLNEQEIMTLNNYTNLKPLCSKVNRDVKRDNLTNPKFFQSFV